MRPKFSPITPPTVLEPVPLTNPVTVAPKNIAKV